MISRWPLRRTQPANLRPATRVEPEDWTEGTRIARTQILLQTFANTYAPNTASPPVFPSLGALTELCPAPTLPDYQTIRSPSIHADRNNIVHMAWTDGADIQYLRIPDPTDPNQWAATPTTLTPPLTCYYTAITSTHDTLLLICATLRTIYACASTDGGITWSSFASIRTTPAAENKIQNIELATIPYAPPAFALTYTYLLPAGLGPVLLTAYSNADASTWYFPTVPMSQPYSAQLLASVPVSANLLHVLYQETSLVNVTTAHHYCAPVTVTDPDPNAPDITYNDPSISHIRHLVDATQPYTFGRCYLISLPNGARFLATSERSGLDPADPEYIGTTFHPVIVPLHTLADATYTEQATPLLPATTAPEHVIAVRVNDVLYWILGETVYTQSLAASSAQHPLHKFSATANTRSGAQYDITLPANADPVIGQSMRLARLLIAHDGAFTWRYTPLLPLRIYRHRSHTRVIAVDAQAWLMNARYRISLVIKNQASYDHVDAELINLLVARVGVPVYDENATTYIINSFVAAAGEPAGNVLQRIQPTAETLLLAHQSEWAIETVDPSATTELSFDATNCIAIVEVEDASHTSALQLATLTGATPDLGVQNLIHALSQRHISIRPVWFASLNYGANDLDYDTMLAANLLHLDNPYLQITVPFSPLVRLLHQVTVVGYDQANIRGITEQWQNGRHTTTLSLHRV